MSLLFRNLCLEVLDFPGQKCYFAFGVCDSLLKSLLDRLMIAIDICSQGVETFRVLGGSL